MGFRSKLSGSGYKKKAAAKAIKYASLMEKHPKLILFFLQASQKTQTNTIIG
jgi:hypothetical protein